MRTPGVTFSNNMQNLLGNNQMRLNKLMTQIGEQKRVTVPSDDPVATTHIGLLRRELAINSQFQQNINRLASNLSLQETHINAINQQLLSLLDRLREANNSTLGAGDMQGYASMMRAQLSAIVGQINASDENGRYLFGGTRTDRPPLVQDASSGRWFYQGNEESRATQVGHGVEMPVNTALQGVFGPDFATLNQWQALIEQMDNSTLDPTRYMAEIGELQQAIQLSSDRAAALYSDLGGRQNNLTLLANAHVDNSTISQQVIGELEALDMGEAVMRLNQHQLGTQASYKSFNQIAGLSLFQT